MKSDTLKQSTPSPPQPKPRAASAVVCRALAARHLAVYIAIYYYIVRIRESTAHIRICKRNAVIHTLLVCPNRIASCVAARRATHTQTRRSAHAPTHVLASLRRSQSRIADADENRSARTHTFKLYMRFAYIYIRRTRM